MTFAHAPQQKPRRDGPLAEFASPLRPLLALNFETKIILAVLFVLSLWGVAILTFGVPALVWPMKFIVPTMIVGMVLLVMGLL